MKTCSGGKVGRESLSLLFSSAAEPGPCGTAAPTVRCGCVSPVCSAGQQEKAPAACGSSDGTGCSS